jgi:hypothetical protein
VKQLKTQTMRATTFFTAAFSTLFLTSFSFAASLDIDIQKKDITCFGQKNGTASVTVNGGEAPYQILWNNGATATELVDLAKGTYSITVTDAKGAIATETVEIKMPEPISVSYNSKTLLSSESLQADFNVNIKGGTPALEGEAYKLQLEENLMSNAIQSGLYKLSITDGNGCKLAFKTNINVQEMGEDQISLNNPNNGFGVIEMTLKSNDVSAVSLPSAKKEMK